MSTVTLVSYLALSSAQQYVGFKWFHVFSRMFSREFFFGVFRPFAAPSKCRPVRPAPPSLRHCATASHRPRSRGLELLRLAYGSLLLASRLKCTSTAGYGLQYIDLTSRLKPAQMYINVTCRKMVFLFRLVGIFYSKTTKFRAEIPHLGKVRGTHICSTYSLQLSAYRFTLVHEPRPTFS